MNDSTKWIMIALLLLLIAAAVFMLLRSPGKDSTDDALGTDDRGRVPEADDQSRGTRAADREVFDQHAPTGGAAVDEFDDAEHDSEWISRAAQIGAVGAAGTAAAAGAFDDRAEERAEVVEVQESTAVPAGTEPTYGEGERGYDQDGADQGYVQDVADQGYVQDDGADAAQEYRPADYEAQDAQAPLEEDSHPYAGSPDADDDSGYLRDAATIGAAGAAGAASAGMHEDQVGTEPVTEASVTEQTFTEGTGTDQTFTDQTFTDQSADAEVQPLSDDAVMEGARSEPLPMEDQEPLTADEVLADGESTSPAADRTDEQWRTDTDATAEAERTDEQWSTDTTAEAERTDEQWSTDTTSTTGAVPDQDVDRSAEYPVGDDTTTYRADDGEAVAVDEEGTLFDTRSEAAATDSSFGPPVFAEAAYGPGSAEPAEDGSGPEGWQVKGNTGSMLFHTAESPSYGDVRAEVWFESEDAARNAGFAHWDRRRR